MPKHILKIGILYEQAEDYPAVRGPEDRFAEFEPDSTIEAMESAIRYLGYSAVRIGAPKELLVHRPDIDIIWNIAEGHTTRNREAWAPVLCEMLQIPCLGSDAHTLSLSLDKSMTKQICQTLAIPTPKWHVQRYNAGFQPWKDDFPVFAKPRYEGTAKGIDEHSVIHNNKELQRQVAKLKEQYKQDILVEFFLPGNEYTCAVAGYPLKPLPLLQRALHRNSKVGLHAIKKSFEDDYDLTHHLSEKLEIQLHNWTLKLCSHIEVKDFARIDYKMDEAGNPYFLEINPLPTFAIDNTFAILSEIEGKSYEEYLGGILKQAIERIL
jgi:D-alanine-D-alanine ligase